MSQPSVAATLNDITKRAMDAYWKAKDLPAAVQLLRDGINRGEAAAEQARANDPALAKEILGSVKAMAFNLASFTWPGWFEPGINISAEQMALGRDAAALNYRLAVELDRPVDKVAMAHWLLGAHELTARRYDEALRQFALYRQLATDDANRHLAEGYSAIAAAAAAGRDSRGDFDAAVAALNALDTQDGRFYAEQLMTVWNGLISSAPR